MSVLFFSFYLSYIFQKQTVKKKKEPILVIIFFFACKQTPTSNPWQKKMRKTAIKMAKKNIEKQRKRHSFQRQIWQTNQCTHKNDFLIPKHTHVTHTHCTYKYNKVQKSHKTKRKINPKTHQKYKNKIK